ncbi:hypothetical protein [Persephonella sp.]
MPITTDDLYQSDKEELKKKLEHGIEEKKEQIKETVGKVLPQPAKNMLQTPEGTYALIAIAVILVILLARAAGMALKLLSKLILLVAVGAAIYFSYLYFTNY